MHQGLDLREWVLSSGLWKQQDLIPRWRRWADLVSVIRHLLKNVSKRLFFENLHMIFFLGIATLNPNWHTNIPFSTCFLTYLTNCCITEALSWTSRSEDESKPDKELSINVVNAAILSCSSFFRYVMVIFENSFMPFWIYADWTWLGINFVCFPRNIASNVASGVTEWSGWSGTKYCIVHWSSYERCRPLIKFLY